MRIYSDIMYEMYHSRIIAFGRLKRNQSTCGSNEQKNRAKGCLKPKNLPSEL